MNEHLFNENDFGKSICAFYLIYCTKNKKKNENRNKKQRNEKQKSLESSEHLKDYDFMGDFFGFKYSTSLFQKVGYKTVMVLIQNTNQIDFRLGKYERFATKTTIGLANVVARAQSIKTNDYVNHWLLCAVSFLTPIAN